MKGKEEKEAFSVDSHLNCNPVQCNYRIHQIVVVGVIRQAI